jgi:hypothetical protein
VPAPMRSITLDLALLEVDDLVEQFDPRLRAAVGAIRDDPARRVSPLRDELLARVGQNRLGNELAACMGLDQAADLLGAMSGSGIDVDVPSSPPLPLARLLEEASRSELLPVVQAAAAVSEGLGARIVSLAGGEDAILAAIKNGDPWILDLSVEDEGGERMLRGRRLHVSDQWNPSPERTIKDLAVLGLSCLPALARADLHTVLPGGHPMVAGDYGEFASSGLLRRYARGPAEIA